MKFHKNQMDYFLSEFIVLLSLKAKRLNWNEVLSSLNLLYFQNNLITAPDYSSRKIIVHNLKPFLIFPLFSTVKVYRFFLCRHTKRCSII